MMPPQKPHRSRQDFGTPPELIRAVEQRFGPITWDVAATAESAVIAGERYYSPAEAGGIDALSDDWSLRFLRDARALLWLNPPFGGIATDWAPLVGRWTRKLPWLRLVMLTPASVGSEWFQTYVHRRAMVLALSPRLTFVGAKDPYPKDCIISCWGFGVTGFDVWRWDEDYDAPRPSVASARARAKPLVMA